MISKRWQKLAALLLMVMLLVCMASAAFAVTGKVTVDSLVMRQKPSTSSPAVQTLSKGDEVTIECQDGDWYKVKSGKYTGYVYTRYMKADGAVPKASASDSLRNGSRGEDVRDLQKKLKELGYFDGTADGVFGDKTEEAVRAFQKRNNLTADGIAGKKVMEKLNSSSAKAAEDHNTSDEDGNLREGNKGTAVRELQKRLKELGYYTGTVDGSYGKGTTEAVRAFQKRNNLTPDGVAGAKTLQRIASSSAKAAEKDTAKEEDDDKNEGKLTLGDKGTAVKTLQNKLKTLGYYKGSLDGSYGAGTADAVKAFQKRNKLTADGVAGEKTLKALYSSNAKAAVDEQTGADEVQTELKPGSYGADVRNLQARLKELGYYKNGIDGSYGTLTTAAVKAFQSRNNLSVDGLCGTATLRKLNSTSAKPAAGTTVSTGSDNKKEETEEKYSTLRVGDKNDDVKEMQYRLKELGYFNGYRDGSFGTVTRTAVMAFQSQHNLTVDGVAGKKTLELLYSKNAKKANTSANTGNTGNTGSTGNTGNTGTTGSTGTVKLPTTASIRPGDTGAAVKAVQTRLKELKYYTGAVDGNYGYNTRQAVLAFQKNNKLTQDGIAGVATQRAMASASAVGANDVAATPAYKTEKLDWFNGGASRIPRRAVFQVKDVKTGLIFTAKRQVGVNHMDAEPLTAADTATLKKINGGEFTWHRRAVLVKYNGRVYAASIYSEPHGADTIADNNFDGQFCLHFHGSKTHGTDRVDEAHQACVAQAMKATW